MEQYRAANLPALPHPTNLNRKSRALVEQARSSEIQLHAQGYLARVALDQETETIVRQMQNDQIEVDAADVLYTATEAKAMRRAVTQRGLERALRRLDDMDERNNARLNRRRT
jgi:hypothetical protein